MTRWAGVLALLMMAAPAMAEPAAKPPAKPVEYPVTLTPLSGVQPSGWSLYASMRGRSMDLSQPGQGWADDPTLQRGDIQAGYGWRAAGTTALVGYIQHGSAPVVGLKPPDDTPNGHRRDAGGVIGVGFVLHGR